MADDLFEKWASKQTDISSPQPQGVQPAQGDDDLLSSPQPQGVQPAQGDDDLFAKWAQRNSLDMPSQQSAPPSGGVGQQPASQPQGAGLEKMRQDYIQRKREENTNFVYNSLARGYHQTLGMMGGTAALAGRLVGSEALREAGSEVAQRQEEAASMYPGKELADIGEAEGFGKVTTAAQFAVEKAIENIPVIATALAGGGIGGLAAAAGRGVVMKSALKNVVGGAVRKRVAREALKGAGKKATRKAVRDKARKVALKELPDAARNKLEQQVMSSFGRQAGLAGATGGLEAGGMYRELEEAGEDDFAGAASSLAFGMAAGTVELFGGLLPRFMNVLPVREGRLLKKSIDKAASLVAKGKAPGVALRTASKLVVGAAENMPAEAAQEAVQEAIALANLAVNDPNFKLISEESLKRIGEAAATGAAAGGVFGGVGAQKRFGTAPEGGGTEQVADETGEGAAGPITPESTATQQQKDIATLEAFEATPPTEETKPTPANRFESDDSILLENAAEFDSGLPLEDKPRPQVSVGEQQRLLRQGIEQRVPQQPVAQQPVVEEAIAPVAQEAAPVYEKPATEITGEKAPLPQPLQQSPKERPTAASVQERLKAKEAVSLQELVETKTTVPDAQLMQVQVLYRDSLGGKGDTFNEPISAKDAPNTITRREEIVNTLQSEENLSRLKACLG